MKLSLTDSEWKIMAFLWEQAPQTMTQITAALHPETGWTKHTVMTFLKRMEEKGTIRHKDGGRAKLYYPCIDRQQASLSESTAFLNKVFQGNIGLMLNTMIEQEALTPEELQELHHILDQS